MDPCELRQAKGDTAVRDLVARRVPLFEFAIQARDRALTTSTPPRAALRALRRRGMAVVREDPRRVAATALRRQSRQVARPDGRALMLRRVDELSRRQPAATRDARGAAPRPAGPPPGPDPRDPALRFERDALKVVLQAPHLADRRSTSSTGRCSPRPPTPRCRDAVAAAGGAGDRGRRGAGVGRARWTARGRRRRTPAGPRAGRRADADRRGRAHAVRHRGAGAARGAGARPARSPR